MIYDDQFGLVERGTKGVRGGAVVRRLADEVDALDCMMRRAHNASIGDSWATDQRLMRLCAVAWGDQLGAQRRERYEEWSNMATHDRAGEISFARRSLVNGHAKAARGFMEYNLIKQLAALAPYHDVVADGQRKRAARASGGVQ